MSTKTFGLYLNKDGHKKYFNSDAPEKLIRYVTRTNGKDTQDLISWGGAGILKYCGINSIIDQFNYVQQSHTRRGDFGKYMNHEIFSFSPEGEDAILKNNIDIDQVAQQMARDIFERDDCQVVYGLHHPDKNNPHKHIHFAINSVNFRTGGKRHENKAQTAERNERFNKIVSNAISKKNMESG